jgi:hypothetical protein
MNLIFLAQTFVTFSFLCISHIMSEFIVYDKLTFYTNILLREECRTSENRAQTQVVGGKEGLLTLVPSTWVSPKMAPAL